MTLKMEEINYAARRNTVNRVAIVQLMSFINYNHQPISQLVPRKSPRFKRLFPKIDITDRCEAADYISACQHSNFHYRYHSPP